MTHPPQRLNVALVLSIVEPFELNTSTLIADPVRPDFWKKNGVTHIVIPSPDFYPPSYEVLKKGN